MHNCKTNRRGVSLIEVMVSVLVVALGMLGAAALQATALRNNQGSYEHTQASIAAQGLFDAMRANMAGVTAGDYATSGWICEAPTASSLATRDLERFITTVRAQVQDAACVRVTCTTGSCTVGVRWDDSRATGGSSTKIIQAAVQL